MSGLAEELREAVESINLEYNGSSTEEDEDLIGEDLVNEDLAEFLMGNPIVVELMGEDDDPEHTEGVMDFLDEVADLIGGFPTQDQVFRLYEKTGKKHDPFKNKGSLTLDAAIYGHPNPRSNVNKWNCDCANFKCTCKNTDTGKKRIVNMVGYYKSGRKNNYMDGWRELSGKGKKK